MYLELTADQLLLPIIDLHVVLNRKDMSSMTESCSGVTHMSAGLHAMCMHSCRAQPVSP